MFSESWWELPSEGQTALKLDHKRKKGNYVKQHLAELYRSFWFLLVKFSQWLRTEDSDYGTCGDRVKWFMRFLDKQVILTANRIKMHPVYSKQTKMIRNQVKRSNLLLTVLTIAFKYCQKLNPACFVTVTTNRAVYSGRFTFQNFKNFWKIMGQLLHRNRLLDSSQ